jgi:hypothetical protein
MVRLASATLGIHSRILTAALRIVPRCGCILGCHITTHSGVHVNSSCGRSPPARTAPRAIRLDFRLRSECTGPSSLTLTVGARRARRGGASAQTCQRPLCNDEICTLALRGAGTDPGGGAGANFTRFCISPFQNASSSRPAENSTELWISRRETRLVQLQRVEMPARESRVNGKSTKSSPPALTLAPISVTAPAGRSLRTIQAVSVSWSGTPCGCPSLPLPPCLRGPWGHSLRAPGEPFLGRGP